LVAADHRKILDAAIRKNDKGRIENADPAF